MNEQQLLYLRIRNMYGKQAMYAYLYGMSLEEIKKRFKCLNTEYSA